MTTANDVLKYIRAAIYEDEEAIDDFEGDDTIDVTEPIANNIVLSINDTEFWLISVKKSSK